VYCVWQVVKTPTIILNNPVFCSKLLKILKFGTPVDEHSVFWILLQTDVRKLRVNFRETDYEKTLNLLGTEFSPFSPTPVTCRTWFQNEPSVYFCIKAGLFVSALT
jgi:hypothetical protein